MQEARVHEAAKHLHYEIWMLYENAMWLTEYDELTGPSVEYNSHLESMLLHVRALTDFFYNGGTWDDDVVAADFMPEGESWDADLPARLTTAKRVLTTAKRRADKELVHLTFKRVGKSIEEKGWNFIELQRCVWDTVGAFFRQADRDRFGGLTAKFCELQVRFAPKAAVSNEPAAEPTTDDPSSKLSQRGLTGLTHAIGFGASSAKPRPSRGSREPENDR